MKGTMKRIIAVCLLVWGILFVSCSKKVGDTKAAKPSGSLVIYTNSGSNGRAEWITEYAKGAGFEINVVSIGAGELANRIVAEKNNQIADIVFGLNSVEYEKLMKQEMLAKYTPKWASEVDTSLGNPDGYYYPIVIQPLILVYNSSVYNANTAPKDHTDLIKPEFKDKYNILKLSGGTSKTLVAGILVRYPDKNGVYGISAEGWDMMKKYIQNGHIEAEGEDYFKNLVEGKRPITQLWGSGLLQNIVKYNTTSVDFVVPEIGVPYVVEQIALFKNAKNPELAKKFIDWFGTSEVQSAWSQKFGTIPVHPKAMESTAQNVKDMMARVHPQHIDWGFVAENLDKWMEKIQLEFVK